jgi:hypothetical protein
MEIVKSRAPDVGYISDVEREEREVEEFVARGCCGKMLVESGGQVGS